MLKLNNSFCRYWRLTCENVNYNNKTYAKQFTHWSCSRKTCLVWNSPQILSSQNVHTGVQWCLLANTRKRFRFKKSFVNSNVTKYPKQMSESLEPTLHHVSYGGQFQVSDEDSASTEWRDQTDKIKRRKSDVPSDFRIWEPVGKVNDSRESTAVKFRILSYNVLAQYLLECHPYLYTDCSPQNLKWKVRAAKIYDEILQLAPDILCLQEVQVSHLSSFYKRFEQLGYYGIFKQKTGHRQDGCAIYFKQSQFDILDHISHSPRAWESGKTLKIAKKNIDTRDLNIIRYFSLLFLRFFQIPKHGVEFYQPELPILNRDNIGLIVKLSPKNSPSTPIVVATTHLLYNPKRTDVRLAQLQVFLAEIDRFAYNNNGRESDYLPIILTGDFNSTPDSAVIQLLGTGRLSARSYRDNSDWKRIGVTDNCQHLSVYLNRQKGTSYDAIKTKIQNSDTSLEETEKTPDSPDTENHQELFNSDNINHPFKLISAYNTVKPSGDYEATTFQDCWITVDYIYFSYCSSLKLVERLRLPTASECEVLGQLPNDSYGSDHLALAATFELKPVKASL